MLWLHGAKIRIAERMAYRGEYFISLITMFVLELTGPFFAFIIYHNTPGFAGWTFFDILLLQGILLIVKGFSFFSFHGIVWNSNLLMQKGELDTILLKPRNSLWMLICSSFDAEDIAKFVGGLIITGYALFNIQSFTMLGFFVMIILMICACGFYFMVALLLSSFIIRFIQSWRIYEIVEVFEVAGEYPKSIYPKSVGTFFTTLIPIFIAGFLPAKALLGAYSMDMIIAPLCVLALCLISLKAWFSSIRNYSSAGG